MERQVITWWQLPAFVLVWTHSFSTSGHGNQRTAAHLCRQARVQSNTVLAIRKVQLTGYVYDLQIRKGFALCKGTVALCSRPCHVSQSLQTSSSNVIGQPPRWMMGWELTVAGHLLQGATNVGRQALEGDQDGLCVVQLCQAGDVHLHTQRASARALRKTSLALNVTGAILHGAPCA